MEIVLGKLVHARVKLGIRWGDKPPVLHAAANGIAKHFVDILPYVCAFPTVFLFFLQQKQLFPEIGKRAADILFERGWRKRDSVGTEYYTRTRIVSRRRTVIKQHSALYKRSADKLSLRAAAHKRVYSGDRLRCRNKGAAVFLAYIRKQTPCGIPCAALAQLLAADIAFRRNEHKRLRGRGKRGIHQKHIAVDFLFGTVGNAKLRAFEQGFLVSVEKFVLLRQCGEFPVAHTQHDHQLFIPRTHKRGGAEGDRIVHGGNSAARAAPAHKLYQPGNACGSNCICTAKRVKIVNYADNKLPKLYFTVGFLPPPVLKQPLCPPAKCFVAAVFYQEPVYEFGVMRGSILAVPQPLIKLGKHGGKLSFGAVYGFELPFRALRKPVFVISLRVELPVRIGYPGLSAELPGIRIGNERIAFDGGKPCESAFQHLFDTRE